MATNKDDLRGNYGTVGPIEANFVLECNLFALIGYDSVEEAVRQDAQLRRIEALTPHDESFQQGYKYNLGKCKFQYYIICYYTAPSKKIPKL